MPVVETVISCPQSGEEGRQRRDRVDLGGQVLVRLRPGYPGWRPPSPDRREVRARPRLRAASTTSDASAAYRASVPQITATACNPRRVDGAGLTVSMPPDASRFAANVVRMLCSASGPTGRSSAVGRDPSWRDTHQSGPARPRIPPRSAVRGFRVTLRQRHFREVRVLVDAGDRRAPVGDVVGDASLTSAIWSTIVGRARETAAGFDVAEVLPRLLGQRAGEVLDEPGAACGVEHAADVRLLQQQQLELRAILRAKLAAVPGHPPGIALSNAWTWTVSAPPTPAANAATVVRSMFTHGSRCAIIGLDVTACSRRRARIGGAHHLGHPCPELPRGAQLGDRHELVVVGGEPETDLTQRLRRRDSAVGQQSQVADAGGDRPANSHDALAPRSWNAGPSTVMARTPPP